MLSNYIGPISTAMTTFPVVAGLILLPLILVHYWRFGRLQRLRAVIFYSMLFYAIAAYFLVILPLPDYFEGFCEFYAQTKEPQIVPIAFISDILAHNPNLTGMTLLRSLPSNPVFLQAFFNFFLLLPLGFYLRYYFRRSIPSALFIAFAVTLFFELTQLSGLYGVYPCPYRVFDVDDLILNTSGAIVGYAIASIIPFLPDLNRRADAPLQVTFLRRSIAFFLDLLLFGITFTLLHGILWLPIGHPYSILLDLIGLPIWFILIPAIWHGYTPGKRLVFLRIVRSDGSRARLWQITIRYAVLLYVYPLMLYGIGLMRLPGFWVYPILVSLTLSYLILMVGPSNGAIHERKAAIESRSLFSRSRDVWNGTGA